MDGFAAKPVDWFAPVARDRPRARSGRRRRRSPAPAPPAPGAEPARRAAPLGRARATPTCRRWPHFERTVRARVAATLAGHAAGARPARRADAGAQGARVAANLGLEQLADDAGAAGAGLRAATAGEQRRAARPTGARRQPQLAAALARGRSAAIRAAPPAGRRGRRRARAGARRASTWRAPRRAGARCCRSRCARGALDDGALAELGRRSPRRRRRRRSWRQVHCARSGRFRFPAGAAAARRLLARAMLALHPTTRSQTHELDTRNLPLILAVDDEAEQPATAAPDPAGRTTGCCSPRTAPRALELARAGAARPDPARRDDAGHERLRSVRRAQGRTRRRPPSR